MPPLTSFLPLGAPPKVSATSPEPASYRSTEGSIPSGAHSPGHPGTQARTPPLNTVPWGDQAFKSKS